ncbi:MAG TPA: hypothetical protein VFI17_09510 [Solirubrobacterales bacterium]|nr:hypothetical protein [Solirubrobacterales bacterium]
MSHRKTTQLLTTLVGIAALLLLATAPAAEAASGSITNVHQVNGEVEATYTTNMDICDGSYCGWFSHAYQYPAGQPCAPNGSHLTFVGDLHSVSGSETASDRFTPAYEGPLRICLYAYQSGTDYFIAEATFTPTTSISGAIANVHAISGGRVEATYTTNFDHCVGGYCGWFPEAWQYPSSQPCAPNGAHITYVGDVHGGPGSETASDDFYPEYGALRICLYANQGDNHFFIAESVFYASPAPTRYVRFTIGDQEVFFYYPRSCVTPGREVQLRVVSKKRKKGSPPTSISRVDFFVDKTKKTDKKKPWQKNFSTAAFGPGTGHKAKAKITFKQPHGKKVKKLTKSFRIC